MSAGIPGGFTARRGESIRFGPFRLDAADERLWNGDEPIALTPKAFALLRHLAERPGRLQTKRELLDALWPDTLVTDASLHVCVREIRRAIGDESRVPRFVETVHRRGYRFIARIGPARRDEALSRDAAPPTADLQTRLVGREAELDQLGASFARAAAGVRQLVFVTGEPGIGKTALVDAFLQKVAASGAARAARGQCFEHYGPGEAYLPIFEALGIDLQRLFPGRSEDALLARGADNRDVGLADHGRILAVNTTRINRDPNIWNESHRSDGHRMSAL